MAIKPLPKLTVTKAQAIERLKTRIRKGRELSDINLFNEDSLASAKHQFQNWEALNFDALSDIFEDTSIADAYIHKLGAVLNGSASLERKISWFDTDVKNDINKLESLIERINFMSDAHRSKKNELNGNNAAGRDQIIQHGSNSSVHISNRDDNHPKSKKSWHEKWWGAFVLGVIIIVAAVIITNYLHLTSP
jgi:hypothetical protein